MNERDIFLAALKIADHGEQEAFVARACGGDAALRAQVEELLQTHEPASQVYKTSAAAPDLAADETLAAPPFDRRGARGAARFSAEGELRKYLQPSARPGCLGRLGHYEVEEILGQGAFGIVAKAFDEKLRRGVAIETLKQERGGGWANRQRIGGGGRISAKPTTSFPIQASWMGSMPKSGTPAAACACHPMEMARL